MHIRSSACVGRCCCCGFCCCFCCLPAFWFSFALRFSQIYDIQTHIHMCIEKSSHRHMSTQSLSVCVHMHMHMLSIAIVTSHVLLAIALSFSERRWSCKRVSLAPHTCVCVLVICICWRCVRCRRHRHLHLRRRRRSRLAACFVCWWWDCCCCCSYGMCISLSYRLINNLVFFLFCTLALSQPQWLRAYRTLVQFLSFLTCTSVPMWVCVWLCAISYVNWLHMSKFIIIKYVITYMLCLHCRLSDKFFTSFLFSSLFAPFLCVCIFCTWILIHFSWRAWLAALLFYFIPFTLCVLCANSNNNNISRSRRCLCFC